MGAGKQLNIDLTVNANTKQAEKNIQELSDSLKKLADIQPLEGMSLNKDMQSAVTSARELQRHLSGAMNSKTGNLDLSKLSKSLKSANTDIATLSSGLLRAGRDGEQAFMNVQRALSTASVQINKANGLLGEFWITLKNTARWQISSTALHAFVGSLQTAYGYAKNLDESLNNIRIVTGHNIEYMDKFAEKANKAAKALSSTTLDYTNASLIYYQQGLSDEEVSKRTEVTLKMANAAGESAEKISDQLTSVWNNFAKGSDNLEHYADAMVRLGADTASSTDEIADGVQKFASVAGTIGLSFDNAAAALATITATTRESADVVGTALKTLFARIQGLNLGETLDDGTTVNKYSEALLKVGVNIKDANGNLKDMDTLLNEIGVRWQTLERDQKTALAQTVAGVRQYTQFMNLMENFDFYQENVARANNADGSLQEQADIYAESWGAARDRMRAAMEGIYDELLPTQTIIKITDGVTDVISGIETLIKGLGGLKGVLLIISSIALKQLGPELGASLQNGIDKVGDFGRRVKNLISSIKDADSFNKYFMGASANAKKVADQLDRITSGGMSDMKTQIGIFNGELSDSADKATQLSESMLETASKETYLTEEFKVYLTDLGKVNNIQMIIKENAHRLTEEQKAQLQNLQEQTIAASERHQMEVRTLEELRQQREQIQEFYDPSFYEDTDHFRFFDDSAYTYDTPVANIGEQDFTRVKSLLEYWNKVSAAGGEGAVAFERLNRSIIASGDNIENLNQLHQNSLEWVSKRATLQTRINHLLDQSNNSTEEDNQFLKEQQAAIWKIVEGYIKKEEISVDERKKLKSAIGYQRTNDDGTVVFKKESVNAEKLRAILKVMVKDSQLMARASGNSADAIKEAAKNGYEMAEAEERTYESANHVNQLYGDTSNLIKKSLTEQMQAIGNGIIQASQLAMSLGMVSNSFSSIVNLLGDSNATVGQWLSAIGSLSMSLPYAASQMKDLTNVMSVSLATATKTYKTNFNTFNTITKQSGIEGKQLVNTITAAKTGVEAFGVQMRQSFAANPAAKLQLQLLAIQLAVMILVTAFKKLKEAQEEAFAKPGRIAETLTNNYNECSQAFTNMVEAFDKYTSAKEALDQLTKGTTEYKDALYEANKQALDLIQNYPDLNYSWNNGELVISEDSLNKVKEQQQQNIYTAQAAANEASNNLKRSNTTNDLKNTNLNAQLNANQNAALTDKTSVLNNTLRKAIELYQQDNSQFTSAKDVQKAIGAISDQDAQLIYDNLDIIETYAEALDNYANVEESNSKVVANALLKGQNYDNSTEGRMALEASGKLYDKLQSDNYQKYASKNGSAYKNTDDWQRYAQISGLSNLSNLTVTSTRNGKINYSYVKDGQKETGYVDKDVIDKQLAAADAADQLAEAMDGLVKEIRALKSSKRTADEGLAQFLSTGNFDNINKNQYEAIKSIVDRGDSALSGFLGFTGDIEIDNTKAQALGYADAETYLNAVKEAFNSLDGQDTFQLSDSITGVNDQLLGVLTAGAKKIIESNYEDLGRDGGKAYVDTLNQYLEAIDWEELTPDEQLEAWNQFANIDFSNYNALDDVASLVRDYGKEIDTTTEEWKTNEKAIRIANKSILDISTETQNYNTAVEKAKDLEIGKIISKDDYNTLINYNGELAKYFQILADGTTMMIGNPLELQREIQNTYKTNLQDSISEGKAQLVNMTNLSNYQGVGLTSSGEIDTSKVMNQLATLNTNVNDYQKNVEGWAQKIRTGILTEDDVREIGNAYDEVSNKLIDDMGGIETITNNVQLAMNELSFNAQNVGEAEELLKSGQINEDAYNIGAQKRINTEAWDSLDTSEVQGYADYLKDTFDIAEEGATESARAIMKMNQGITTLNENWEEWNSILKKSDKTSQEYYKAITQTRKALSDVLDVSEDFIDADFVSSAENLELIGKVAKGDEKAIDALGKALAEDIALDSLDKIEISDSFTLDQKNEKIKEIQGMLDEISQMMSTEIPKLELGQSVTGENELFRKLQEVAEAAQMTTEEANAYFRSMGFVPEFEETTISEAESVPVTTTDHTRTITNWDDKGNPTEWTDREFSYTEQVDGGEVVSQMPSLKMKSQDGKESSNAQMPKIKTNKVVSGVYTGGGKYNNGSSINTGGKKNGGGSKNKPTKQTTEKSDVVDRYKEITDSLDNIKRAQDKVKNGLDQLYGKSRLDAMDEYQAELQKEIDLLDTKAKKAKEYADEDWKSLQKLIHSSDAKYKFNFVRNKDGNITNYTSEMEKAYNLLHTYEEKANKMTSKDAQDAYREKWVTPLSDYLKEVNDTIDQYDESVSTMKETLEEKLARIYEQYQNMFDKLSHKLEVKITVDDNELNKLNYYFDSVSDNVFKASEAFGYLYSQMKPTSAQLENVGNFAKELNELFYSGKIGEEQYAEGLQQAYDDTLNYLQSLRDLDNQMVHYYEETLQKATEKLTTYTDQMDHLTSVMDHYRSILTLMGRDTDYDKVLEILEGTMQTRKNNFEVSQSWYEQMKKAKEDAAAMLAEARTDAEKEMAQISYDAAIEQFNQAEETMLANAESYGEALKEILTTKMQQAADAMNKALTDGMGWDVLNDSMSRTSAYQDEYLTKTNQIYEMNKLLNQVNSAIDKTDNQGAKNRYAQFAKEIEQLREKNQLSQLELDIAQAKYKVLEAQIALEEAQNAKSTVRLQRDSEGNFGYVYTADQDKVNDAEQALADAENDLYNIRLNATNKYGQQKLQYEQELAEKLAELDEKANDDALYREGNYQEDRKRLIEEYQKLIEASNDLYNLAQEKDARVVQDAWVNGYKAIIDKGNEWKTAVGDYTDAINNAIGEWEDASSTLNTELENTTRSVEEITTESDAMYNQLKNDLIPTLGRQLDLVEQITLAYQHQRDDILKNIKVGEIQLKQLQRLIELQASYTNANNGAEYASGGDYSLMMGNVAYGSDEYWSYYTNRQGKLNKNPGTGAVSNEDVDRFYFLGYKLGQGMWSAYSKFQQIPADKWADIREEAKNAGWVKHFDTGGYTGKWGTEGRLAFLHQKELVLNADDTSNFLKAVNIVREIAQTIDLRSGSMFRGVGPYLPPVVGSETQGVVDQQVSIQASFPNVVSHNEIEEAFNNLINTSVQYANRKIK